MRAAEFESRRGPKFRDPQLIKAQQFAKAHYPTYGSDPELAFTKWTQRALGHSELEDQKHDVMLKKLNAKVEKLAAELKNLKPAEQLDELSFMGSQCTKDCSGHRAGYEWYKRKGYEPASWSNSFNNGAAIAASGR